DAVSGHNGQDHSGDGQGGSGAPDGVSNGRATNGVDSVSSPENGRYDGVQFKDNLRPSELPSAVVARGVQFDPAQALVSAVRRALEPKDNQKSDEAKAVEQLRNALLPSTNTARAAVLQRTNSDSEFEQQLSDLTSLIQTHPGLEHNRAALHSFGMMLNRVSTLSERTPTSPLLTAIMA
ncbi:TPA: hypothetical protein ACPFI9_004171, partial [Providencia rettgeri]